ncbi:MAG: TRAP transporter substrate-binding protein [Desulfosalsimonas sp.]|uniref:TRAP transporter substrate-binding protein n=1 Tax=Desulfosalsimonas sp. TaxID=3073848 RepID=UPI00397071E8
MNKTFFLLCAAACMLFLIAACGQSDDSDNQAQQQSASEKSETIELSYSVFFPPTHAHSKAAEDWAKQVEDRTDNSVKINMYPGGTLTGAAECYDGVVSGISDIGMSCFAYTRGRFPVMEAVDLPLGYPDGMTATRVANQFYRQMDPEELKDVKVLYLHAHGPGLLHTKKPVETLADIKGMQIRSTGLSAKMVKALGATPVAMPQGDTYEALQKGVVEGTFAPMETLKGWRQGDVIDYTTNCQEIGYTTTMFAVMNKEKFNQLPEEVQDVINTVSDEWIEVHGQVWDDADKEGLAYTREQENEIIELSEEQSTRWKDAISPVIDEYITDSREKDIEGQKSVDLLRSLIEKQN